MSRLKFCQNLYELFGLTTQTYHFHDMNFFEAFVVVKSYRRKPSLKGLKQSKRQPKGSYIYYVAHFMEEGVRLIVMVRYVKERENPVLRNKL